MAMTLITTNSETNAASSSFTSGIDSTYKLYIFKWYDVNPATDNVHFTFQVNAVDASGFNETITSTAFRAYHYEDDSNQALGYVTGEDQAEGTAYQVINRYVGGGADESAAGELFLFNPSNTTYVKHFYCTGQSYDEGSGSMQTFVGGCINITAAVDEISFKMSSGNFDGTIKMYGVG